MAVACCSPAPRTHALARPRPRLARASLLVAYACMEQPGSRYSAYGRDRASRRGLQGPWTPAWRVGDAAPSRARAPTLLLDRERFDAATRDLLSFLLEYVPLIHSHLHMLVVVVVVVVDWGSSMIASDVQVLESHVRERERIDTEMLDAHRRLAAASAALSSSTATTTSPTASPARRGTIDTATPPRGRATPGTPRRTQPATPPPSNSSSSSSSSVGVSGAAATAAAIATANATTRALTATIEQAREQLRVLDARAALLENLLDAKSVRVGELEHYRLELLAFRTAVLETLALSRDVPDRSPARVAPLLEFVSARPYLVLEDRSSVLSFSPYRTLEVSCSLLCTRYHMLVIEQAPF